MAEPVQLPAAVDKHGAMKLLGVRSVTQLARIARTYPEYFKPFNFLPKGDLRYSTERLLEFVKWRERQGLE